MLSAFLFSVLAILSVILFWWRRGVLNSNGLKDLKGPYGLPWLGYLPWIDSRAPYETFAKLSRQYGSIYSLKLGGLETVFLSDPALIRQAFSRDVFSGRAPLYLTHGIMKGQGWRLKIIFIAD